MYEGVAKKLSLEESLQTEPLSVYPSESDDMLKAGQLIQVVEDTCTGVVDMNNKRMKRSYLELRIILEISWMLIL